MARYYDPAISLSFGPPVQLLSVSVVARPRKRRNYDVNGARVQRRRLESVPLRQARGFTGPSENYPGEGMLDLRSSNNVIVNFPSRGAAFIPARAARFRSYALFQRSRGRTNASDAGYAR